jgi:hypothetical protein
VFAALTARVAVPTECIIEMESVRRAKVRIELKNLKALAGLTKVFWSTR